MIKDIAANLAVGRSRDVTTDFAVSVAASFDAHLAGVASLYEPILPTGDISGIPPEVIDMLRAENEKVAKAAANKFDAAVRGPALSAEVRMLDATDAGAPNIFAEVARRFDLSITAQPDPHDRADFDVALIKKEQALQPDIAEVIRCLLSERRRPAHTRADHWQALHSRRGPIPLFPARNGGADPARSGKALRYFISIFQESDQGYRQSINHDLRG